MSRDLPSGMAAAIAQKVVRYGCFLECDFAGGFLRLWSGNGDKAWDSKTWQGVGSLLAISPVDETTEIGAAGLSISLSGLHPGIIAVATGDNYRGRPVRFWLALFSAEWAVEYTYLPFAGRMDVITIDEEKDSVTVSIKAENRLIDLTRARMLRYTPAEQQRLFPGDTSMRFVGKLAERPLPWGIATNTAPAASNASYGGGGGNGGHQVLH